MDFRLQKDFIFKSRVIMKVIFHPLNLYLKYMKFITFQKIVLETIINLIGSPHKNQQLILSFFLVWFLWRPPLANQLVVPTRNGTIVATNVPSVTVAILHPILVVIARTRCALKCVSHDASVFKVMPVTAVLDNVFWRRNASTHQFVQKMKNWCARRVVSQSARHNTLRDRK